MNHTEDRDSGSSLTWLFPEVHSLQVTLAYPAQSRWCGRVTGEAGWAGSIVWLPDHCPSPSCQNSLLSVSQAPVVQTPFFHLAWANPQFTENLSLHLSSCHHSGWFQYPCGWAVPHPVPPATSCPIPYCHSTLIQPPLPNTYPRSGHHPAILNSALTREVCWLL
jgi:hypothetical protein